MKKNVNKLLLIFFSLLFYADKPFCENNTFTIAVISDTQNYSDVQWQTNYEEKPFEIDLIDIYYRQMEYIAKNSISNGGDIVFAIHLGDLVQHSGKYEAEWENAERAMTILDGQVPFGVVPGNHDYDKTWVGKDKKGRIGGSTFYNKYFGPDSKFFNNKEWYGGATENGMNSWSTFKVDDVDFLFLGLEIEPSDEVLEWAQKVLDNHKSFFTILVMHEYLWVGDEPTSPGTALRLAAKYKKDVPNNSATEVWEKLISKNKQIVFVLCGHSFKRSEGENSRTDLNEAGFKVYQLLSDYQGRTEILQQKGIDNKVRCGDGWMRFMTFDLKNKKVYVQTYSTEMEKFETDTDSNFTIIFDWDLDERFYQ